MIEAVLKQTVHIGEKEKTDLICQGNEQETRKKRAAH